MIFPSVTEEEIAAIKSLSYDDRQSLLEEINRTDPHSIFTTNDHASDEIICPLCGNGTGKSHTGVKPTLRNNGWLYGCRKPNCQFNGLLTTIIGKELGLDKNIAEDLYQILAVGAKFCGIPVSHDTLEYARRRRPTQSQQHLNETKPKKDYSRWYEVARKNLPAFIRDNGGTWRGFTLKELQEAGIGLSINDDGRRILIPYDKHHCLGRAVDPDTQDPKKHFGSKTLAVYNFGAVDTEHVIFVVEGEIDCLSIKTASGSKIHVVATGGVECYPELVKRLNQTYASAEVKPRFCVLADNDEGSAGNVGQDTAPKIVAALMSGGYPAVNHILSEQTNFDANDWFVKDRAGLFERMKELEDIAESELEAVAQDLKHRAKTVTVVENENSSDTTSIPAELTFIKSAAARADFMKLRSQPDSPARSAAMTEILRDNLDWRKDLKGKKTSVKPTSANYRRIFYNDPVLSGLFGFDEFYQQPVFIRQAPWRKRKCIGEPWTDDDDARLRIYLRENYGELSHNQLTPDYFRALAQDNSFNVVQDWITNLPAWDGTPRAETVFIKFLNVDDTAYAREVSLNWLLGAMARIFYPGCNYHYCLILQGQQGIGKSHILERLGGDWYVDLKDSVDDPKSIDAIQIAWLVEIGELSATRKADVNSLKVFLSESFDTHRFAYERRAVRRPRHCVFAGTNNDEQPLNDQTGARRFNILKCGNKRGQFVKGLDKEYVAQIWAETYHKFRQLFPTDDDFDANQLLLSPESQAIAARLAEGATADDGLEGEIAAFLDKPIPHPAIWRLLTKNERNKFFGEAGITIASDILKARQKARRRPKEAVELEAALEDMTTTEIKNVKGETIDIVYRLYGDTYRQHICAAEIVAEMSSRPDRRLNMRRVNEVLSLLSGWEKGERIQGDSIYGDQRNIYYRTIPLEFDDGGGDEPPPSSGKDNDDFDGDTGSRNVDSTNETSATTSATGNNSVTEENEFDGYDPSDPKCRYNGTDFDSEEANLLQCKYYYWRIKNCDGDEAYNRRQLDFYRARLEANRAEAKRQHDEQEEEYWREADLPF